MRSGFVKILGLVIIVLLVSFGAFVLSADSFEREAPRITARDSWNLQGVFPIALSDNVGIRSYSVAFVENGQKIPLETRLIEDALCQGEQVCIGIIKPQSVKNNAQYITLEVHVRDSSNWGLFRGNATTQQLRVAIDTKRPELEVVANSYKVMQGGSALVIFRAFDEALQEIKITNGNLEFQAQPFYKEGYYIALIAWSKLHDNFLAKITARDFAGNVSSVPVSYVLQKKRFRNSTIALTDSFIDGKISALVKEIGERNLEDFEDRIAMFRYINEEVRQDTFDQVFSAISMLENTRIDDFKIMPFSPLKNGAVMASFGDYRIFTYAGQRVSESHHMGLDLASVREAPVLLSNPGIVAFNAFAGIDGNTLVINHGLGLSTLYAHLTTTHVELGESLNAGSVIANTGNTGLSLGDHLHFGVLVQGHEVWNAEWMDAQWIERNIHNVIAEAKAMIDKI